MAKDAVKTSEESEKNEDILNCHAMQFCRLIGLCDGQSCSRRLKSAILNQNTLPPSLYFLVKDHKPWTPGDPLPARPVCGAKTAHNGQLGFMLSKVLDAASDVMAKKHATECSSTQDLIAAIEERINQHQNIRDLVFVSSNVVSLYPSLLVQPCATIIARMLREGDLVVEGINWDQAVLYLAVTLTRARVQELGLQEVVPARRKTGGRGAPGIVTKEVRGPLQEDKDWESSLFFKPARSPTEQEKKQVFSLCVEQGLLAALGSHLYTWHQEVKKQEDGLGIGLDLARAAGRLVMLDWDLQLLQLARDNELKVLMYKWYMDDSGAGLEALKPGVRWSEEEGRMILHPHLAQEDLTVAADFRTMRELFKMGNSIHPMIQLTGDCPSNNASGKMPMLDIQVWVEGSAVQYEHYRKPMANPLVMLKMSTMPSTIKRTTLTQEVVRIR